MNTEIKHIFGENSNISIDNICGMCKHCRIQHPTLALLKRMLHDEIVTYACATCSLYQKTGDAR